jgi:hypothetical protein
VGEVEWGDEGTLWVFPQSIFLNVKCIDISELDQVCWHRSCKYFWANIFGQIFLGLVKRLISTLDKVILLQRNNFSGVYKTSLHVTK